MNSYSICFGLTDEVNRKKSHIPIYSFADHQRQPQTTTLYSPRVLILEGILALHDPRIVELLDVKVSSLAITCLSLLQGGIVTDIKCRSSLRLTWMSAWAVGVGQLCSYYPATLTYQKIVLRDVKERGRDIEGIVKQWFTFVKPSYTRFVAPQRGISGKFSFNICLQMFTRGLTSSDIIIPRGIENLTAIGKDQRVVKALDSDFLQIWLLNTSNASFKRSPKRTPRNSTGSGSSLQK